MTPDKIRMFCKYCGNADCEPWVIVPRHQVTVLLNLESSQNEFVAVCPACHKEIFNSRPM